MSEIPPTDSLRAEAPAKPPRALRLSDEAESIVQRRGHLRGRAVAEIVNRLNLRGESNVVRRENEIIINSFRKTVTEQYGPSIAQRTVRDLASQADPQPIPIGRRAVSAGFRAAHSIHTEVRAWPEVQPFLAGGARFDELCRRFPLARGEIAGRYERTLIDAIVKAGIRVEDERLGKLAETAASDCAGFTIRPETERLTYLDLTDLLARCPGRVICIGNFATRGIPPAESFANFGKRGSTGVVLAHPKIAQVKSLGDKVHLNVNRTDMHKAWDALQPLLLSQESPFLRWKVIILENEDRCLHAELKAAAADKTPENSELIIPEEIERLRKTSERATEGMQFTLYAHAGVNDLDYASNGVKYRHFLAQLDGALAERGVRPGRFPESDVSIRGFVYASYRNEIMGTRGATAGEAEVTQELLDALKGTAFYRAISP